MLTDFCESTCLDYHWATDQQRIELHIAAVFCSNFTNYLYCLSERFCLEKGLEKHKALLAGSPMMEEVYNFLTAKIMDSDLFK